MRLFTIGFWLALLCVPALLPECNRQPVAGQATSESTDAAPSMPTDNERLSPRPHAEVRFHAQPKPLSPDAVTEDWPSFLGPNHNASSGETRLLKQWPEGGPTLVWEMNKGEGFSSLAIQGDFLVFFHRLGDEEVVECLHPANGESYWDFRYPTTYRDRYGFNNGPRASPVIDEDRVYTYGVEGKLHCLALATGQIIWKKDLAGEFRAPTGFFGITSTPLVEGDRLIVNVGAPGGPCVVAFDKRSGNVVWKINDQWGASYASPIPGLIHSRRWVFVFAGGESRPPTGGLLGIDPAEGVLKFRFPWRSQSNESVNAASPVVIGDRIFITASYETGGAMLEVLPDGRHELAWKTGDFGAHWNTPVHRDGYLYGFDGRHNQTTDLVCYEVAGGKEQWREQPLWQETVEFNGESQQRTSGTFRGSLLWADGHFLCLGEMGHLLWLDLSPQGYRELARAKLFSAPETWALPVLSRGLLYVVQNQREFDQGAPPRLLCYDLRDG